MPVICVIAVGVTQADINAKVDPMILWIPPAGIDDLIGIGRCIYRAIGDAIVDAVMTVIIDPIAQAVRPVSAAAGIAYSLLWWRCSGWLRGRTILVCHIAREGYNAVIKGIVWGGVIEDGFLRGCPRIRRI
jgi:hypothetical protein